MSKTILSENYHGDEPALRTHKWHSDTETTIRKMEYSLERNRHQSVIHRCTT